MLLEALRLKDFRNLRDVELSPHPRFNLFTGQNGQGKTNLLEAIYLLSAVKSFRSQATNRNLIGHGRDQAELFARVDRGGHVRDVGIEIGERGKRITLNGQTLRNVADFFGTLNVVIFGPDDIGVLKGSPSERRRFIDRAIFNARPAYGTEATHFEEVLKNRNALLKEERVDGALLSIYDDQLVEWGAQILRRRLDFIDHFRPVLKRTFRSIFGDGFEAEIGYQAEWADQGLSAENVEEALRDALFRTRQEERHRGYTLVGPHRDDLRTELDGHDLRAFGSQGQTRAFILAMKIAEITYLEERYRFAPILLLDDVSSELDRERNRQLFAFLRDRAIGQVFITTTHRDHILLEEDLRHYQVVDGEVRDG
jgi:DNA replication and repair protein RecF